MYGRNPPPLVCYDGNPLDNIHASVVTSTCDQVIQLAKDCLLQSNERMKMLANKGHWELSFQVNDSILVKLKKYHQ